MRPNSTFSPSRPLPQPGPEPPPSWLDHLRLRLSRFYTRFQKPFLIGMGILIAFAAMALYDMTGPPPQHLTQNDINAAVERALESGSTGALICLTGI